MKARYEFESREEYEIYLRIYFAAQAMQGMLANSALNIQTTSMDTIAGDAINQAESLLKAL